MRLLTDYRQYYDDLFDGEEPVFHRTAFTRGGLSKQRQFELFEQLHIHTPPHGTAATLAAGLMTPNTIGSPPQEWLDQAHCVVYLDELAHGGAGKAVMPVSEALAKHPEAYCSLYVAPRGNAINFRHARIGRVGVWLRQRGGDGEWLSNRRDFETVLRRDWHPEPSPVSRVMWAIDFIPSPYGLLAVDFNTAPDLNTLGETNSVGAGEILEELRFAARACPDHLKQF